MDYIKSPLNYTGGKFKLLPQIIPLFPSNINTFVDLFGGGFNVGINVNCNKIIYNEITSEITDLFKNMYINDYDTVILNIESTIFNYNNVSEKEDFLKLRKDYNENKSWDKLFVLSCYGFNYSIRFNNKGEYNVPSGIGKCKYSVSMKDRIFTLKESLDKKEVEFHSKDFRELDLSKLTKDDFVYIDPPYLITKANYNNNWKEQEEKDLLDLMDNLNKRGVRFALSNVIKHKGLSNDLLIEWAKKYNVYYLNMNYNNSWYANKSNGSKDNLTIEVLITNYDLELKDVTNDKYKKLTKSSNEIIKEKQLMALKSEINASTVILG